MRLTFLLIPHKYNNNNNYYKNNGLHYIFFIYVNAAVINT